MLSLLKSNRIEAIKSKDEVAKSVLTCLLADADALAKKDLRETTDADVSKAAKSLVKKLEENLKILGEKASDNQRRELSIAQTYAPKSISAEDTKKLVEDFLNSLSDEERVKKNQGKIMGLIKGMGDVDMKVAASLVSSALK